MSQNIGVVSLKFSFEIKHKDGLGRTGILSTPRGKITTPTIMPVINPNFQTIPASDMKKYGVEAIITNSYIIYKNEKLRKRVIDAGGIHNFLNFNGIIATDSGGFQLYMYGDIDISQDEIEIFQQKIGSDLAVILDTPPPLKSTKEETKSAILETIKRAEHNRKFNRKRDKTGWYGPVHGHQYPDLVKESVKKISSLDFDIIAIGSSVQMFIRYMFYESIVSILNVKKYLSPAYPVHLFGAGHPMFISAAVLAGCDIFDSAFYVLAARDGRYITESGTKSLDNLEELPCSCEICSKYTARELKNESQDTREKLLAHHNLAITMAELRKIRIAIRDGSLHEHVLTRLRAHPKLLEIAENFHKIGPHLAAYDYSTKHSAFFYTGRESIWRPEVLNFKKRFYENYTPEKADIHFILPDPYKTPFSETYIYKATKKKTHIRIWE